MRMAGRAMAFALFVAAINASAQAPVPDAIAQAGTAMIEALRTDDLAALEARFDANMKRVFPHDKVVETAAAIKAQVGALKSCAAPTARMRGGVTVVDYRCEFERSPLIVRLAWTDAVELTGLFFTPVPAPAPAPVAWSADVRAETLTTGAAGWPLPATLLVPTTVARPPVVVFVHGSGPNDRDETIGPNAPFRDLASGLAARGIASLRYEKRTRALGVRFAAETPDWTVNDEVVDDAVAAVALVAARDDLGPVFVVGHSLGALMTPRIAAVAAAKDLPIAGVVLLAAPLTPLYDIAVDQYTFLSTLPAPTATQAMVDDIRASRANLLRLLDLRKSRPRDASLVAAAATLPLPLGMPASAWIDLARYDPAAVLRGLPRLPALLVFGGRDYQVPVAEKARWEAGLQRRADTDLVVFPTINHLLIEGDGPMGPDEYARAGHVSAALIDRIAGWIANGAAKQ